MFRSCIPQSPLGRLVGFLLLASWLLGAAVPCLWDYDTLQQERSRFPTALELITGQFPRHSESYYRWRIEDREARMAAGERTPEIFDDIAVAHSKLGDDKRAIALMAEKEALHPGLYETIANLGTFHIHAGELEKGADYIVKAIQINPDAHFGREIYQELIVRYVLAQRAERGASALPLDASPTFQGNHKARGFWKFILDDRKVSKGGQEEELVRALRGVMGMLRFGNHDSPVLLEALSDLLLADSANDAKRLATRALLKASYETPDEQARHIYRSKAASLLQTGMQTPSPSINKTLPLEELEKTFQAELVHAKGWWAKLEAQEQFWIKEGADVDGRFADVYFSDRTHTIDDGRGRYGAITNYGKWAAGVLVALGVVLAGTLVMRK